MKVGSSAYREFQCGPSEQFDGFTWCQRSRRETERRNSFNVTSSILHDANGSAFYINRSERPASFDRGEVNADIDRISRRIGKSPRLSKMPSRAGLDATIAVWGKVELEPLDSDSLKILAEGKSPKKGFLIDFIGDFTRSAKEGLPVYRIGGGAGFVWAASYDRDGRGTLRSVAVDASRISPNAQVQNSADAPKTFNQAQQGRIEPAEDETAKPNTEVARIHAEAAAAKADAENARIEAEEARAETERSKTEAARIIAEERARIDAALTRLETERANSDTTIPSMQILAYGAIVSLLTLFALVAFLLAKLKRSVQTNEIRRDGPPIQLSAVNNEPKAAKAQVENGPQAPPLVPQDLASPLAKPPAGSPKTETNSTTQPKCERCHNDISAGAKFCSHCGVSVGASNN